MSGLKPEITSRWQNSYDFHPFSIATTSEEFSWSRRTDVLTRQLTPSNKSAVYTIHNQEVIIGGVLQGRKQSDPNGASSVSRRKMWQAVRDAAASSGQPDNTYLRTARTYRNFKSAETARERKRVKDNVISIALKGWIANEGDSDFSLDA